MDHSRQAGIPPLPTPRFRTVDGWKSPASAPTTRTRCRSGTDTRTASAAGALEECELLCYQAAENGKGKAKENR